MKLQSRLKNYGFWVAFFAFLPILADALKIYDINLILPDNYETLINAFLGILVVLGLVNDPTTQNRGFGDDKGAE